MDKMAPKKKERCAAPGCETPPRGYKEYCVFHAQRLNRGIPFDTPRKRPKRSVEEIMFRDSAGRKQCYDCGEWLPERDFWVAAANADGRHYACKECLYLAKVNRKYNKSPEWYREQISKNGGVCPLCLEEADAWHVDHDHGCCGSERSCGACVRGVICARCNRGLGYFKDDPDTLRRTANYLESHSNG